MHDASVLFLNVDLLLMLPRCHLVAMIERMQRNVMDCCRTAVIYKTRSWERFDVTSFLLWFKLLLRSFSDILEASRETLGNVW